MIERFKFFPDQSIFVSRCFCYLLLLFNEGATPIKKCCFVILALVYYFSNPFLCDARTISFAGHTWDVRSWYGGPGSNYWSDSTDNVWVDGNGYLHLRIRNIGGTWYCSEVIAQGNAEYGINRFYIESNLDQLDKNVVFAAFLYKDANHEIDIEFTKWGESTPDHNSQYVVQPYYHSGNLYEFWSTLSGTYTTHYIDWQSSYINFKSIHGHYDQPPSPDFLINYWSYTGADIPHQTENLRVYINLWLVNGNPPFDGQDVEVVVHNAEITKVLLSQYEALMSSENEISVRWRVQDFSRVAGWNIYRCNRKEKNYIKINNSLIPDKETSYKDKYVTLGTNYYYKLEGVYLNGSKSMFGPVSVSISD